MNSDGNPYWCTASIRKRCWCCQNVLENDLFSRLRFGEHLEALEALTAPVIVLNNQRSY